MLHRADCTPPRSRRKSTGLASGNCRWASRSTFKRSRAMVVCPSQRRKVAMADPPKRYSGSNPMAYRISAKSFGDKVGPEWLPVHDAPTGTRHLSRQPAAAVAAAPHDAAFSADSPTRHDFSRPAGPDFPVKPSEADIWFRLGHPTGRYRVVSPCGRQSSHPDRKKPAHGPGVAWSVSRRPPSWTCGTWPTGTPAEYRPAVPGHEQAQPLGAA